MGSLSGGSKRENVQKENALDLSKFLHFADPDEINLNHVLSIHKIEEYLKELVKRNLGPSGPVSKLQTLSQAQTFLVHW